MDLVRKGPDGRLDPLAACMLLWSESLTFDEQQVTWDGKVHHVSAPTVNKTVISLHGVAVRNVEARIPDLLDLLEALGKDEELHVPHEQLAPAVQEVLITGHLSGTTLFLLQSGSHPLVIELVDEQTLRVRYDEKLARGIPHLQDLLCRLLSHLQYARGHQAPFTVLFDENDSSRIASGIADFEGLVDGGCAHLEPQVEVPGVEDLSSFYARAGVAAAGEGDQVVGQSSPADRPRALRELDLHIHATRALAQATRQRLDDLAEAQKAAEGSGPRGGKKSQAVRDMTGEGKAMRSLVIRSIIYLAIGLALITLGYNCATRGNELAAYLTHMFDDATGLALDFVKIMTGNANTIGTDVPVDMLPLDPLIGGLRLIGYLLMCLGVLFPIRKIYKHKRKLDHEMSAMKAHRDFLFSLSHKQELQGGAFYEQSLGSWASELNNIEREMTFAKDSLGLLEETEARARQALDDCCAAAGLDPSAQASSYERTRHTGEVTRKHSAEPTEEQRHQFVVDHCAGVDATIAAAKGA